MRILSLSLDAFGGHGGIAQYNRDLLTAVCGHPSVAEVVAIPYTASERIESLPENLTYIQSGLNSKFRYILASFSQLFCRKKFDLVICGHISIVPLAILIGFLFRLPVVLVVYGVDCWQPTKSFIVNNTLSRIDAFVSISEFTLKRFLSWSNIPLEKAYLLPNAINQDYFGAGPKPLYLLKRYGLKGKKVILTLGRIMADERAKGFDEVIELLPDLLKKIPELKYLVAGSGTDVERLRKKVELLGIAEQVIFAGKISEKEKADHYRLADAYVMPSRLEGFGFVFLEAIACGIPVVASKIDGSREAVLNGKLGIIVDPDDPDDIKLGILKALSKSKAVPDGLNYFSFENFTRRLHQIINEVTRDRHIQ